MHTFFLTNGILTNPGALYDWQDNAERYIEVHTGFQAIRYEYKAWPITRRLSQGRHIREFASTLRYYVTHSKNKIHAVNHSNGCEIALQALKKYPSLKIDTLHLIAPAVDADCTRNGINDIVLPKDLPQVNRIFLYVSADDEILKIATWSKKVFGWMGLGYGDLGRVGLLDPSDLAFSRITTIDRPYLHSQWFWSQHFSETMDLIISNANLPPLPQVA